MRLSTLALSLAAVLALPPALAAGTPAAAAPAAAVPAATAPATDKPAAAAGASAPAIGLEQIEAAYRSGDWAVARAGLEALLVRQPDDLGAWVRLAHATQRQDDWAAASHAYQRAIALVDTQGPGASRMLAELRYSHALLGLQLAASELGAMAPLAVPPDFAAERDRLADGLVALLEPPAEEPLRDEPVRAIAEPVPPRTGHSAVAAGAAAVKPHVEIIQGGSKQ
ncbi:hypothetical protein [Chitinimonas koreensis]|uniref:hypothetical protein n=1 Tax=Chitinimonas koreensis TaxID=356302 RepID=UPI00054F32C8|nr:hypothetical protein [Chitinimonas koreensis]QNM97788.1 hypothetical protein H9L41_05815 [Chitinimonas koreensis]